MRRRILAIAPLALFLGACTFVPKPYTAAASTYGDDTAKSADALSAAPSVLTKSCWKAANAEYLQERLIRIKAEAEGIPLPDGGSYYVPFTQWRDKAPASTAPTMTWTQYCTELGKTGSAFTSGVSALTTYAKALQDLAKPPNGTFDGADIKTATDNVGSVITAVGGSAAVSSKAVSAIGDALKALGVAIMAQITEDKLKGYVAEADPKVGKLIDALQGYVTAVDGEFSTLETREKAQVDSIEILLDLGKDKGTLPACALVKSARAKSPAPAVEPHAEPPARPEKGKAAAKPAKVVEPVAHAGDPHQRAIADACDTLEWTKRHLDTTAALSFYQYSVATLEDLRETRAALNGFKAVLDQLKTAHGALKKSGEGDPPDFKALFGALSDLVTTLQSLQSALGGK